MDVFLLGARYQNPAERPDQSTDLSVLPQPGHNRMSWRSINGSATRPTRTEFAMV